MLAEFILTFLCGAIFACGLFIVIGVCLSRKDK